LPRSRPAAGAGWRALMTATAAAAAAAMNRKWVGGATHRVL